MYPSRNNRPSRGAAFAALLSTIVLLLSFAAPRAPAQEFVAPPELKREGPDPGHFEVRSARLDLDEGVYFLTAAIDYRLSSEAREALESGVPLRIRLEVEFLHPRRFWFDNEDATLNQSYQLEYHALSERYIVQNLNSGVQDSFASVYAALNFLGRIENLPLLDAAVLDPDRAYEVRLRTVLDVDQFPGPLRLLAFWRRDWSLASDWYRWQLQDD